MVAPEATTDTEETLAAGSTGVTVHYGLSFAFEGTPGAAPHTVPAMDDPGLSESPETPVVVRVNRAIELRAAAAALQGASEDPARAPGSGSAAAREGSRAGSEGAGELAGQAVPRASAPRPSGEHAAPIGPAIRTDSGAGMPLGPRHGPGVYASGGPAEAA